jgi:hypothetical protein
MAEQASGGASAPKPSSSVKLVLLGEAAVGKVRVTISQIRFRPTAPTGLDGTLSSMLCD